MFRSQRCAPQPSASSACTPHHGALEAVRAPAVRGPSAFFAVLAALLLLTSWASADKKVSHRKTHVAKPPSASVRKALSRAERLGLGKLKSAGRLLSGAPEDAWVRAAHHQQRWTGTLRFPVRGGRATRGFGSGAGGYHQAVDIAAELGTKVHAASGGIVGYAGSQVSGYGNLVILVHPGGFVTTYAHNRKNLVVAGQRVRRNEVIAELGSTGKSRGPHVHFELLWNGQNCDPMPLFRPVLEAKDGGHATRSVWKQPHRRPRVIRCGARKHHPDYRKSRAANRRVDNDS